MECPRCHTANENGATTCINCGLRLTGIGPTKPHPQQVKIVDIEMRFWSMVVFLVKLAIAAIPAMIILSMIVAGLDLFVAGLRVEYTTSHSQKLLLVAVLPALIGAMLCVLLPLKFECLIKTDKKKYE
jgi:hypothetical protein